MNEHRQLLDAAVARFAAEADSLRGAAIFVTGGGGFLAASLIAFLSVLDRTARLRLRLYANARRAVREVRLFDFLCLSPDINWVKAPVEEVTMPPLKDLIVVHAASYGSPRDYLRAPLATFSANTGALVRLLETTPALRQFVYFSSAEIYGQPPDAMIPTPESYIGQVSTVSSRSIYAESKRMGEVLAVTLAQQRGIPLSILRPWNVYGPGQRPDDGRVPIEFVRQARETGHISLTSDGSPTRALCYVWDAISQIASILGDTTPQLALNIGNPTGEISMRNLARECAKAAGLTGDVVTTGSNAAAGLTRCVPDVTAVRQRHRGCEFTPLATGLRTLIDWHGYVRGK